MSEQIEFGSMIILWLITSLITAKRIIIVLPLVTHYTVILTVPILRFPKTYFRREAKPSER